jgi:dynein assembly factor 3
VNFYVIESSLESVARQILFLNLALEAPETLGLQEKAEMFLELFGNSFLRPKTRDYLSKFSRALIKMSTDLDYMKGKMPLVDLSQLKFKERDFLETILKFWRECDVKVDSRIRRIKILIYSELRVRDLLTVLADKKVILFKIKTF